MPGVGRPVISTIKGLVRLARPRQWLKNGFVLAAPIYGGALIDPALVRVTVVAAIVFCGLSSAVYVLNDLKDVEQDRLHPVKRNRPIASGAVSPILAALYGALILAVSAWGAWELSFGFFLVGAIYLGINVCYTLWWKHVVVLDILSVAAGFVLRVIAGAVAADVILRAWILVCTLSLALLISLGKRRSEVVLLGADAGNHRRILGEYPLPFLDRLIGIAAALTLLTYSLFTFDSGHASDPNHAPYLMATIPFVLYGVFRYLYLLFVRGATESPENLFLHDPPMIVNAVIWGALTVWLFHSGL